MSSKLSTVYCTKRTPAAIDRAREKFGADVEIGLPNRHDTAPFGDAWIVIGYVSANRTGPACPVLRRRLRAEAMADAVLWK